MTEIQEWARLWLANNVKAMPKGGEEAQDAAVIAYAQMFEMEAKAKGYTVEQLEDALDSTTEEAVFSAMHDRHDESIGRFVLN